MHPDSGLSTIPDEPNTLTCQYSGINDAPRDPIFGHVANWKNRKIDTPLFKDSTCEKDLANALPLTGNVLHKY